MASITTRLTETGGNGRHHHSGVPGWYKTGFLMAMSAIGALITGQIVVTKNIMTRQDMDIMEAHQTEVHKQLQEEMNQNTTNIQNTTRMVDDLRGQLNIMKSDLYNRPLSRMH